MKKIKAALLFALIMISLSIVAIPGRADADAADKYMRSAIFASGVDGTFDGFELPRDAVLITDSAKSPMLDGNNGNNLVGIGGNMCLRTAVAEESDSLSIIFDLKKELKEKPSDSKNEDNAKDGEDNKKPEVKTEGIAIKDRLALGIYVSSPSGSENGNISAALTLTDSKGNEYVCNSTLYTDRPYVIYADPKADADTKFESLRVVITRDGSLTEELSVSVSLPTSTGSVKLDFLESCKLLSIISHSGKADLSRDLVTLGTNESEVVLSVLPESSANDSEERVSFLMLECTDGEGTVLAVSQDGLLTYSSHSAFGGGGAIPVRTVRKGNAPMKLSFRSSSEKKLTFKSITYHPTNELYSYEGTFTTLTYSEGKINATGKLSTKIIDEYSDATVGLYTTTEGRKSEIILLDEIKMTSRFSFSASLEKYPHAHTDNAFFVGIITEDNVIPVTKKRFVSAKSPTASANGILGLHGANPISVFEAGAPSVLVDVDLSQLINPITSSTVTINRGGYIYGVDADYLSRLDADMSFYRSIGVSVQIRYLCTDHLRSPGDGSWLTYDGLSESELMLRGDTPEALNIYPAATSLLSQRYDNISSFVISSGVNSVALTGISHDDPWNSVCDVALIARLIYGAASDHLPGITVSIPLKLSGDDLYTEPETFATLLGERLSSIGDIPWNLVYTADSDTPSLLCENIKSALRLNGGSSPLSFTVIYEADMLDGNSTANYERFCDACSSSTVKRVFLSVKNAEDTLSRESYSALKNYGGTENSFAGTAQDCTEIQNGSVTGSISLWDFSTTYSHEGWNAGYGMSALQSASLLDDDHTRVLRAITDPSSPAGIFLCSLDEKLDLKNVPFAEFIFDLDADAGAKVVIIFGNETSRAEFALGDITTYKNNGKLHAVCDLSSYAASAGSINYVGIIIYSDERSVFDLSKVSFHSTTLDSDELKAALVHVADETEDKLSPNIIILCAIAAFILLVVVVRITSGLAKHDAKNRLMEKSKIKEKRTRIF